MQPVTKYSVVLASGVLTLVLGCVLGWYGFPTITDNMIEKVGGVRFVSELCGSNAESRRVEAAGLSLFSGELQCAAGCTLDCGQMIKVSVCFCFDFFCDARVFAMENTCMNRIIKICQ